MSEPLVIIGNGMAAARLCEELSARALGRYAIAVVGKEPRLAYNRVLLSSVLAGEVSASDITVKPADWWRKHGVTLCYGTAATAVDIAARTVTLDDNTTLSFGKLVFATGSRAVRLPIAGADLPGVLTFRDLTDTESLVRAARRGTRAVVIGGGLLGIEAAYGLAKAGGAVTLIHLMDRLMERQLDARAAAMLKRAVEAKGIDVQLEAATARLVGNDRVEAVELKDGRILPADTVVIAVGIAPNAEIARAAGLTVNRGIVVDDELSTSDPNIFAIGECAEHRGVCYGLVEPANDQARVLAERFAGRDTHYNGSVNATNLKVSGVHVFSAGDFLGAAGTESIVLADAGLGTYRKLVIEGERLAGAVLCGDTADAHWYLELLRSGASIESMRGDLVFGRAFAERKAGIELKPKPQSQVGAILSDPLRAIQISTLASDAPCPPPHMLSARSVESTTTVQP
jgi:nitrite reductase (NADH) large subunit